MEANLLVSFLLAKPCLSLNQSFPKKRAAKDTKYTIEKRYFRRFTGKPFKLHNLYTPYLVQSTWYLVPMSLAHHKTCTFLLDLGLLLHYPYTLSQKWLSRCIHGLYTYIPYFMGDHTTQHLPLSISRMPW